MISESALHFCLFIRQWDYRRHNKTTGEMYIPMPAEQWKVGGLCKSVREERSAQTVQPKHFPKGIHRSQNAKLSICSLRKPALTLHSEVQWTNLITEWPISRLWFVRKEFQVFSYSLAWVEIWVYLSSCRSEQRKLEKQSHLVERLQHYSLVLTKITLRYWFHPKCLFHLLACFWEVKGWERRTERKHNIV